MFIPLIDELMNRSTNIDDIKSTVKTYVSQNGFGNVNITTECLGDKKHGTCITSYKEFKNDLIEIVHWDNGVKHGCEKRYINNSLNFKILWKEGIQQSQKSYRDNGIVEQEKIFGDNITVINYYKSGQTSSIKIFNTDNTIIKTSSYYKSGDLMADAMYNDKGKLIRNFNYTKLGAITS